MLVRLMRVFRRSSGDQTNPTAGDVIWGVGRREGYSDTDDPAQHSGVTQHAFMAGQDRQAICGYEPPRRRAAIGQVRPQLATVGPANPRCPRCEAVLDRG